jgi:hypothetical protein
MAKAIYFDMDGTIADLYAVENWLPKLRSADASPYEDAIPMVKMNLLARLLNRLQKEGYTIGIVSWLAKNSDDEYDEKVTRAKKTWLETHLASVHFDEIHIVKYGTPKQTIVDNPLGILFDDEAPNREKWLGTAHDVDNIIEVLKSL